MTYFLIYLLIGLFASWAALMAGIKPSGGWLVEIIAILTWPGMFVVGFIAAWRDARAK